MNQVKIGQFIQELRRNLNLTQKELGDKLNVSDKTISKWETGNGMPELSFLKPLSDILGITVNELLCGERITESNFKIKTEESIVNTIKYSKEEIKKNKISMGIIFLGVCLLTFTLLFFSSRGMKMWFSIISLMVISLGIYKLKNKYKLFVSILFFTVALSAMFAVDYNNTKNNAKEPLFSYSVETKNDIITYRTLFYNVYRCNSKTVNEYYEIDFSRNRSKCTNSMDPNKSDISRLTRFQNKYLGNNWNTTNLFNALPLSKYGFIVSLDSTNLGIIINYNRSEEYINEDNRDEDFVEKCLLYNSVSTFILIDNVNYINYNFSRTNYKITREDVVKKYASYNLITNNDVINESNFKKYVNDKLKDTNFINSEFNKLFSK